MSKLSRKIVEYVIGLGVLMVLPLAIMMGCGNVGIASFIKNNITTIEALVFALYLVALVYLEIRKL